MDLQPFFTGTLNYWCWYNVLSKVYVVVVFVFSPKGRVFVLPVLLKGRVFVLPVLPKEQVFVLPVLLKVISDNTSFNTI